MTASQPILVTGGAGFIGSFLCQALLEAGRDVTEPFETDVDQIYSLACPASPLQHQRHLVQTGKTAVLGSINRLELARYSALDCVPT